MNLPLFGFLGSRRPELRAFLHLGFLLWIVSLAPLRAQVTLIEPDDFVEGAVLDGIEPGVHLTTAGRDNKPIPPVSFQVTATTDNLDFATTGSKVFGQANVPFWNTDRRLMMEFATPVSVVSIDFAGGQYFAEETGRLDAYDASGVMVASYVTAPMAAGHMERMILVRERADVALAIAYVPEGLGVFGRLDNLHFGVASRPVVHIGIVNGTVVLTFQGDAGLGYRVWGSSDTREWTLVGTPTEGSTGSFSWVEGVGGAQARRFYRVSSP